MDKTGQQPKQTQEKPVTQPRTVEEYQKHWDQMLQETDRQISKYRENEAEAQRRENESSRR
ncbi:hypothetical protein N7535_001266 [Penicillium sp. DV-2018c]|nr:hypothetical protein N7461_005492 [Penicillium sp. DV-2018c]KAJ5582646.1 hypothetical protein N7535_001266 [Penicillium sp. DV-2018c]